jgi:hypothetical protein
MERRFSFGVLRSEQTRLRGFCGTAGTICLGQFSADSLAVKSGVLNQIERAGRKAKLMLGNVQAASVAFHIWK